MLEPIHLFVTGGAEVGKSHIVKCIYNVAHKLLRSSGSPDDTTLLLLAPTGTAAHNICGHTVHSTPKIPVNPRYVYQSLASDTLRCLLENVQIIIVDEFSMISPLLLEYMNGRLRQIKGVRQTDETKCFEGVCVFGFGDFYQLSPVKAASLVLEKHTHGDNLFRNNFQQFELTHIMRQRENAAFAQVLNRLRVKTNSDALDSTSLPLLKS